MADNRSYYDSFAKTYDDKRSDGYHRLIDDLEIDAVTQYCKGKKVLEAGCGSGLLLQQLNRIASFLVGTDLSKNMLDIAKTRHSITAQSDLRSLPFPTNFFDTVVSFKVLAHIQPVQSVLKELTRITAPDGILALEFYNPYSIRGLIKKLKSPTATSDHYNDEDIITRFDSITDIKSYLPHNVKLIDMYGVRVITPFAQVLKIPVVSYIFRSIEFSLLRSYFSRWGGFIIIILKKKGY